MEFDLAEMADAGGREGAGDEVDRTAATAAAVSSSGS